MFISGDTSDVPYIRFINAVTTTVSTIAGKFTS